jgi:hypothetical protein
MQSRRTDRYITPMSPGCFTDFQHCCVLYFPAVVVALHQLFWSAVVRDTKLVMGLM